MRHLLLLNLLLAVEQSKQIKVFSRGVSHETCIHENLFCLFTVSLQGGCNAKARGWYRINFHDAGTFNRTDGSGGADGSIQYELDRWVGAVDAAAHDVIQCWILG